MLTYKGSPLVRGKTFILTEGVEDKYLNKNLKFIKLTKQGQLFMVEGEEVLLNVDTNLLKEVGEY